MRRAIELAQLETPHPNPRVGAVLVDRGGVIVGEGSHRGPGHPHAEVLALQAAPGGAGATLVVTLEPCAHHGRTPPCVEAIIESGVENVIVGALDPDSRVAGRGVAALQRAGIAVTTGILEADVTAMDEAYFHHRRTGRPLFRLKLATTLDGQSAAADGTSQWISNDAARADGHRLRAESDAVMVGAGTLIADDPALTVRLGDESRQPRPVIVAGARDLPPDAGVMARNPLIYSTRPRHLPGEVVVAAGVDDRVDLEVVAKDLAGRGLLSVLVEGGRTLHASLFREGLADRLVVYVGAMIAGGRGATGDAEWATLTDAYPVAIDGTTHLDGNIRIDATVVG